MISIDDDDDEDINDAVAFVDYAATVGDSDDLVIERRVDLAPWATDSQRTEAFDYMFRSCVLPHGVWKVVFQPRALEFQVYCRTLERPQRVPARTINWWTSPISFQFGIKRRMNGDSADVKTWKPPKINHQFGRYWVMQDEGLFCGVYCINNLARGLIFNPGQALECVASQRRGMASNDSVSMYADRDQIVLMALREGVVLASINFGDPNHCEALMGTVSGTQEWPFEKLIRESGGVALLFPSFAGAGGHYICVAPLENGTWVTYDTNRVVTPVPSTTVGQELIEAIARRFVNCPPQGSSDREVVGLIALPVRTDVLLGPARHHTLVDMWILHVLQSGITTSLGEFTCPTVTPLAVNYVFSRLPLVSQPPKPGSALDPQLNLFTLYSAQFAFQSDWNNIADSIASMLVERIGGDASKPRLKYDDPGNFRKTAELASRVTQLSSGLRPYLGLLFVSEHYIPDREWLRYMVVYDVSRRLGRRLRKISRRQEEEPDNIKLKISCNLLKFTALVCITAWLRHKEAGENPNLVATTHANLVLLVAAGKKFGLSAVFGAVPTSSEFSARVNDAVSKGRLDIVNKLTRDSYDRALYLFESSAESHCSSFTIESLAKYILPVLYTQRLQVELFASRDRQCPTLEYLRRNVFVLPERHTGAMPGLYNVEVLDRFRSVFQALGDTANNVVCMLVSTWAFSVAYNYPDDAKLAVEDRWKNCKETAESQRDIFPHLIDLLYNVVGFETVYVSVFKKPANDRAIYTDVDCSLDGRLRARRTMVEALHVDQVDVVDMHPRNSNAFSALRPPNKEMT